MLPLQVNIPAASLVLSTIMEQNFISIGDNRKIVEHKAIRDDLALMYQLGVVKPTAPQCDNFLKEWKGERS